MSASCHFLHHNPSNAETTIVQITKTTTIPQCPFGINVKVLSHDFTQPFGKFEGTIKHKDKTHNIIGYGPVEEHESLW